MALFFTKYLASNHDKAKMCQISCDYSGTHFLITSAEAVRGTSFFCFFFCKDIWQSIDFALQDKFKINLLVLGVEN